MRLLGEYADALNQPTPFTAGLGLRASDFEVAQRVWTDKPKREERSPFDDERHRPREARSELDNVTARVYEILGEGQEENWAAMMR